MWYHALIGLCEGIPMRCVMVFSENVPNSSMKFRSSLHCVATRAVLIHYFLLAISSAYHRDTRDNISYCRPV